MITEDYVSFEIAKLLKEKGFDGPCNKVWETNSNSQTLVGAPWFVEGETVVNRESVEAAAKQYAYEYNLNNKVEGYLAPTLQMACKWLREIHWIDIIIEISDPSVKDRKYYCMIWDGNNNSYILDLFNSYEEACEVAIKYCLENLI